MLGFLLHMIVVLIHVLPGNIKGADFETSVQRTEVFDYGVVVTYFL